MTGLVVALTILGFLITAAGLVTAYFSGRKELTKASERIEASRALARQESAEADARPTGETGEAIHAKYEKLYAEQDLVRPRLGNLVYLPAYESRRLIALLFDSTRSNLLWAGFGLLLSTVASVWSPLLPEA